MMNKFSDSEHYLIEKNRLEEDDRTLPPRKTVHPSNKIRMMRIFYTTLVIMFAALVVGLVVWGIGYLE